VTDEEIACLERLVGFRVQDYPDLFDFVNSVETKRRRTPSLEVVTSFRGNRSCAIAYPGQWQNSRRELRSCHGIAEVVDHVVPLSSNRVLKTLARRALPGRKVQTQGLGSAHISNLIGACKPCNQRKIQTLDGQMIRRILAIGKAD
jgi:5-methylcytosine-specific restriction endonuclease McrA